MSDSLLLDVNVADVTWVLDRLKLMVARDINTPNVQVLRILQNPAIFYACTGVKRDESKSTSVRRQQTRDSYHDFVVPAWFQWLVEEVEYEAPGWLTKSLMGQTTLSDKRSRLYAGRDKALWRRMHEIGRETRGVINPIIDEYSASSTQDTALPSGTTSQDLLYHIHNMLWRRTTASRRKMRKSELQRRRDRGGVFEIVNDAGTNGAAGTPAQVVNLENDDAETKSDVGADPAGTLPSDNPPDAGAALTGTPPSGNPPNAGTDAIDTTSSGIPPDAGADPAGTPTPAHNPEADADPEVEVWVDLPPDWLHAQSLIIVLFGKISKCPDHDLNLSMTSGPPHRKIKRGGSEGEHGADNNDSDDSSTPASGISLLSKRCIKMAVPANESQSRAEARKSQRLQDAEVRSHCHRDNLLDAIKNPPKDEHGEKLVSFVGMMATAMTSREARASMDQRVTLMKLEISTLKELGEFDEAAEKQRELLVLLKTPIPAPVVPVQPAAGSAASGPPAPAASGSYALAASGPAAPSASGTGGGSATDDDGDFCVASA